MFGKDLFCEIQAPLNVRIFTEHNQLVADISMIWRLWMPSALGPGKS